MPVTIKIKHVVEVPPGVHVGTLIAVDDHQKKKFVKGADKNAKQVDENVEKEDVIRFKFAVTTKKGPGELIYDARPVLGKAFKLYICLEATNGGELPEDIHDWNDSKLATFIESQVGKKALLKVEATPSGFMKIASLMALPRDDMPAQQQGSIADRLAAAQAGAK